MMARHRWMVGNLIILVSCIVILQASVGNTKKSGGLFGNVFEGVKNAGTGIFEGIKNTSTGIMNDAEEKVTNTAGALLDIKDKAVQSIMNSMNVACNLQVIDPEYLLGMDLRAFVKDMRSAINEKKTDEWVESINRLFNVKRVVEEIKTSKISKVTCSACKFLMLLAKFLMLTQDDKTVAGEATAICTMLGGFFEAKDPSVCKGIMESIGLDAIYAIRHSNMRPAQLCQVYFGDECLCGYDKKHDWVLSLPERTKNLNPISISPSSNYVRKLKILQITDIHFDPYYQPGSESNCDFPACCRGSVGYPAKSPETAAGNWGDYRKCDSPQWLVENAFKHIADTQRDIDYIYWTGDVPPHDIWNQSRAGNLGNFQYTTNLIKYYFGHVPILPTVGNHESFPIDSFVPPTLEPGRNMNFLYQELANEWSDWLPAEAIKTVLKGGYYSILIRDGLRVISLNGNYCGRNNFLLMINSNDPFGELAWLMEELENAERNGEKVHILNHVPPGQPDCLKAWSHNYYDIINRFQDTIVAQFYGHTHFDEFEVFYDKSDLKRAVGVAYIAPSITPWKDCNPAYRIYYVDGDHPQTTRAVTDFETWTMDLDQANKYNSPRWYKSYNARSEYNMKSLLPREWDDLIQRMATNRTLFDIYHRNYYRDTPTMPKCDDGCRRDRLCDTLSARSHDRKYLCHNLVIS